MTTYKIYDFLESNDFEKESNTFTSSVIAQIVKPDNIEGFIFSWFVDYDDPQSKKDILPFELREKHSPLLNIRNPDLFDFANQTITLAEKEIMYITDKYFSIQIEGNYKRLFADLDAFHRQFESQYKFSIKECYNTILYFLKDNRGIN